MLLADVYRILTPDETIHAGDQFHLAGMSDDHWGPVSSFIGKRVGDVHERGKIQFRRLVCHEVQV